MWFSLVYRCICTNDHFTFCTNFWILFTNDKWVQESDMISSVAKYEACASSDLGLCLPNFLLICHIGCAPMQCCYIPRLFHLSEHEWGHICLIENVVVGNSSACSDLFWFTCIHIYIYIYMWDYASFRCLSIVQRVYIYAPLPTWWLQQLMWSCVSGRSVYTLHVNFG